MELAEYINKNRTGLTLKGFHPFTKPLLCADGFRISIQASKYHFCSPEENLQDAVGYRSFELGYPSEKEELILEYADDLEDAMGTVYPYVPIEIVVAVLDKHGGIKGAEPFGPKIYL